MCICWCVTYIDYKMHGATIKKMDASFWSRVPSEKLGVTLLVWKLYSKL